MPNLQDATYSPEQIHEKRWYAVYTRTRHEKSATIQCTQRGITTFLPLYNVQRRWKQRIARLLLPLFPSYIFVHIALHDRFRVLGLPGIVSLVTFNNVPAAIPEAQIEYLKRAIFLGKAEPHVYLQSGKRVRVTSGPLVGLEGIVIEMKNRMQVVVSFEWMARSVAISLDAAEVEVLC
jgi:transcription termination/antitermination protein NusG